MEKIKFAFQVFIAVLALPLLSMMELNHNKKIQTIDNTHTEQRVTQGTDHNHFENGGKINTVYREKGVTRRYCK